MRFLIFTSKIKQFFPNLSKSKHEFTLFIKIKGGTPRVHAFKSRKNVLREGSQLRVDAFSISNYGSAMFVQAQPQHSPMMLLTPTASAASLGHERQQAVVRDTRFACYCEKCTLADASIL